MTADNARSLAALGLPRFSWRVASPPTGPIEHCWLFPRPRGWALLTDNRSTGHRSLDHFETLLDVELHVERRFGPEVWAQVSGVAGFSAHELYETSS